MKEKIREITTRLLGIFAREASKEIWDNDEGVIDFSKDIDQATNQILAEFKKILPEKQWTHPTSKGLKRNEFISFHRGESHNNCIDIINGRLE